MSATGRRTYRQAARQSRRQEAWIRRGFLTPDGLDITEAGEREAEAIAEARADRDTYGHGYDDGTPHGWSPDPFPGGSLV